LSTNNRSNNVTTIVIQKQTRLNLRHSARKDQTYDDVINELLQIKIPALNKAGANIAQQQLTTGENDTKVLDRLNDLPVMNEESNDSNDNNDSVARKELENKDRLGGFEIQDSLGTQDNKTMH
jgi:hypothetical protein